MFITVLIKAQYLTVSLEVNFFYTFIPYNTQPSKAQWSDYVPPSLIFKKYEIFYRSYNRNVYIFHDAALTYCLL